MLLNTSLLFTAVVIINMKLIIVGNVIIAV